MTQVVKKRFIAALLFISCIIGGWLFLLIPAGTSAHLKSLGQADSLLQLTLSDFNVNPQQISTHITQVNSNFERKTYTISVAPGFSKTQFHSVLKKKFAPYHILLPARIIFPDKDMHIYMRYKNTVMRTVKLVTDQERSVALSRGSIIFAFHGRPPNGELEVLKSMGKPIAAAVIMEPPFASPAWWEAAQKIYAPIYIWPKTGAGRNLLANNQQHALADLEPIDEQSPRCTLLSFYDRPRQLTSLHNQTNFSFVDARNSIIFNEEMERSTFNQLFRQFIEQARAGKRPIAIIMGSRATLGWTREELNTFTKGGFSLVPPPKLKF